MLNWDVLHEILSFCSVSQAVPTILLVHSSWKHFIDQNEVLWKQWLLSTVMYFSSTSTQNPNESLNSVIRSFFNNSEDELKHVPCLLKHYNIPLYRVTSWRDSFYSLINTLKNREKERRICMKRSFSKRKSGNGSASVVNTAKRSKPLPSVSFFRYVFGGFEVHPLLKPNELTMVFSDTLHSNDLVIKSVREYLKWEQVMCNWNTVFEDITVVHAMMKRYELFMRLKAKYPEEYLIPSMDVQAIWMSHLLRPSSYAKDCLEVFQSNTLIPHKLYANDLDVALYEEAILHTEKRWKENYPTIPSLFIGYKTQLRKHQIYAAEDPLNLKYVEKRNCYLTFTLSQYEIDWWCEEIVETISHVEYQPVIHLKAEDVQNDRKWYMKFFSYMQRTMSEIKHHTDLLAKSLLASFVKTYEKFLFCITKYLHSTRDMQFYPVTKYSLQSYPSLGASPTSPRNHGEALVCLNDSIPFVRSQAKIMVAKPSASLPLDLIWRVHMMHPVEYWKDSLYYTGGYVMDHDPCNTVGYQCNGMYSGKYVSDVAKRMWQIEFGIALEKDHLNSTITGEFLVEWD